MESSSLSFSVERGLQSKFNYLNLSCGNSRSNKFSYSEDDEILDPKVMDLPDDEETWLYVADDCGSRKCESLNVMEWLERPLQGQLFNSATREPSTCGPIKFSGHNIFVQSRRSVDSRTYTRPKKRSFRPYVTTQEVMGGCGGDGSGADTSPPTTTTSTNTTPSNNTFSSFGIIDIDNLTDTQLGFSMAGLERWTPSAQILRNRTFERNSNSTPSTVSDTQPPTRKYTMESPDMPKCDVPMDVASTTKAEQQQRNWKFTLDASQFETATIQKPALANPAIANPLTGLKYTLESPILQPKPPTDATPMTNSDRQQQQQHRNWFTLDASQFETPTRMPIQQQPLVAPATIDRLTDTKKSSETSNKLPIDSLKMFNASDLLSISFPKNILSATSTPLNNTESPVTPIQEEVEARSQTLNLGNKSEETTNNATTNNNVENGNKCPLSNKICNGQEELVEESELETPPQCQVLGKPMSFSTPEARGCSKSVDRSKLGLSTRKLNGIAENGRLSDSSTEDAPSISTEDLSEEHNAAPLGSSYIVETGRDTRETNSSMTEISPLSVSPLSSSLKALNTTFKISEAANLKKKRSVLNSMFRKSPLNTTFCKSAETLNGAIEPDSGPEEDGMSTASDSSFSSSSTHMRSVGEIQCIARLQEESLRQQCSPNRMFSVSGDGGNDVVTALQNNHHLRANSTMRRPSDDGNQSDHSDVSSDRYSPNTLNNNVRNAIKPSLKPPNSYRMGMQHAQSVEVLSGIPQPDGQARMRMSGLRPPTVLSRVTQPMVAPNQPAPLQPPGVRMTGLRPPRAIPRPVSRLPAPRVRSALPKYSQRGGRPQ